jgi:hypothetical protein
MVSSKIKLDGLPFTDGEKIIVKTFMNKLYKSKEGKVLNFSTLVKKNSVIKPKLVIEDGKLVMKKIE